MITLGAQTDYSFLRGFGTVEQWAARCEALGIPALCIADHCSTWGHTAFYLGMKGHSTKLLYGVSLPVVTTLAKDQQHDLVTLIARSTAGLSELYKAMGTAEEQMYYKPRLTWEQVSELAKEACFVVVNEASIGSLPNMRLVPNLILGARPVRDHMRTLIRDSGLPIVPAYMPRYPRIEDKECYTLFQAIAAGVRFGEADQQGVPLLRQGDYEAMMRAIGIEPQKKWFRLAADVAEECSVSFPQATKIKVDAPKSLGDRAAEGAARMGINIVDGPYAERLRRELHVIREKDFEAYFHFVADLCAWARERMFVGPARGSSAGSLLCFLLGITTVDPLKFGTLFERFIDITRPDWPDIDIDFPDTRRDECFTFLREKYGVDHVARLGTVSEFGAKGAVNDTAKALGVPYDVAREAGRILDGHVISGQLRGGSLADLLRCDPLLAKIIEKHPELAIAGKIFEHARHHGVHAAGVVVVNEPARTFGHVDKHGVISMDMKQAEKIGMIKMDALGLRTLSVIQECCDLVEIDPRTLYNLDWKDQKVFDLFNADRVTGVFQFEGHAVRQLMKQIKVESFDDLSALTSLARPGPLVGGAAAAWCDRRNGKAEWDYEHPSLEPHLRSTYGTIVYQEQAMSIVRDLGGFDEPAVNKFRRAIGKKEPEELKKFREMFLEGCKTWHERGEVIASGDSSTQIMLKSLKAREPIPEETAAELWDSMCEFGSYAFNLSHAVAYSMISYMAAHLKAMYPLHFAVANLRNAADDDQGKQLLRELADEGYEYVPFDPHRSEATWAIIDGKLYGGFDSVKGVGPKTARELLAKREANPGDWLHEDLTESQRDRLTKQDNTPWHSLTYFGRAYASLYDDPLKYRSKNLKSGVSPPVYRIKDIPAQKGTFRFLGKVLRKWSKSSDKGTHWNIIFADDTGEIGATINRFKVSGFDWLIESDTDNRDFLVKGDIIGDDRRWLFIDQVVELDGANDGRSEEGRGAKADTGAEQGAAPADGGAAGAGTASRSPRRGRKDRAGSGADGSVRAGRGLRQDAEPQPARDVRRSRRAAGSAAAPRAASERRPSAKQKGRR